MTRGMGENQSSKKNAEMEKNVYKISRGGGGSLKKYGKILIFDEI